MLKNCFTIDLINIPRNISLLSFLRFIISTFFISSWMIHTSGQSKMMSIDDDRPTKKCIPKRLSGYINRVPSFVMFLLNKIMMKSILVRSELIFFSYPVLIIFYAWTHSLFEILLVIRSWLKIVIPSYTLLADIMMPKSRKSMQQFPFIHQFSILPKL